MKNRDDNGRFVKGNSVGPRFTSEKQPENPGKKGKSVNEYLRELGNAQSIEFSITINDPKGKIEKSGKVESFSDLNELLAVLLFYDALVEGDFRVRKEILDRTEGKPKVSIDIKPGDRESEQPIFPTAEELEAKLIEIVLKSGIDLQALIENHKKNT